jgi:hypothetical protein
MQEGWGSTTVQASRLAWTVRMNSCSAGVPGELPAVGAFADVGDDDLVDEAVLEVVVAKVAGHPERLDVAPVAAASVDAQGCCAAGAAFAFVVAGFDEATYLDWPFLTSSEIEAAGTTATFS